MRLYSSTKPSQLSSMRTLEAGRPRQTQATHPALALPNALPDPVLQAQSHPPPAVPPCQARHLKQSDLPVALNTCSHPRPKSC
jgi:hypothetical protein